MVFGCRGGVSYHFARLVLLGGALVFKVFSLSQCVGVQKALIYRKIGISYNFARIVFFRAAPVLRCFP